MQYLAALQDIVFGRKCLDQTSLNLTLTDSKIDFLSYAVLSHISMYHASAILGHLPIDARCKSHLFSSAKYTFKEKYQQNLKA